MTFTLKCATESGNIGLDYVFCKGARLMPELNDINSELEQLKIKETYLEVINSFATILFEAQSIQEIVWAVARHAIAKLNYHDCVIYLYDPEKNKLIQSAAHGPKNPVGEEIKYRMELTPGHGIAGKVFESGVGEIINDTSKDDRYLIDDVARLSEISIPLSYKGEILGVIDSEHPDLNFFSEQDFKLLTTVAAMVSTKLAQARATEELIQYKENLETIVSEKTEELEKANDNLRQQNKEKELLLKEIHHRVKNNMQIMISLLNLQAATSESEHEEMILQDFRDRIRSMAIIHERLYLQKDISNVSIEDYINELSQSILSSFHENQEVQMECNIDAVNLDLDTSIPLGLIINELMTNSLKHAFNDHVDAVIKINLKVEKDQAVFEYHDNGSGFNINENKENSFGLDLIDILAEQIGFDLVHKNEGGSYCSFKIKSGITD